MERRCREPRFGGDRCRGDTQQQRFADGRVGPATLHAFLLALLQVVVDLLELLLRQDLADLELGVALVGDHDAVLKVVVLIGEAQTVDLVVLEEAAVAGIRDADLLEHLAHDHFDVLVVDLHTLHAVHFLDLVHEIGLYFIDALDVEDVVRIDGAFSQTITGTDKVAFLDEDVAADRHGVFAAKFTVERRDSDHAGTALRLVDRHDAVDLRHGCRILRSASFEEFRHARQTARDVAQTTKVARHLDELGTDRYHLCIIHHDLSSRRNDVGLDRDTVFVDDLDGRALRPVTRVDHDLRGVTRLFVDGFFEGQVRHKVAVADTAGLLRDDDGVVRVPFIQNVALGDLLSIHHLELGTVDHVILRDDAVRTRLDDVDHTGTRDGDELIFRVTRRDDRANVLELHHTVELGNGRALRHGEGCRTTGVERTQRKLCTRLTDRL